MSTITKVEKQGLEELFVAMHKKQNLLTKLQNSRIEMIRIFNIIIKNRNYKLKTTSKN